MKSNRRKFIQDLGVGAAGITLAGSTIAVSSCASTSSKKEEEDGQLLFIGDNIAVAETQYGKVKGYVLRGINTFLGIPYGADTSGANRFMPPPIFPKRGKMECWEFPKPLKRLWRSGKHAGS